MGFTVLDPETAETPGSDPQVLYELWAERNLLALRAALFGDDDDEFSVYSDPDNGNQRLKTYLNGSNGVEFTLVDGDILNRCWKHNNAITRVQLQTGIYAAKSVLAQLTQDQSYTDMFIWTRGVPTAMPSTELILMAYAEDLEDDAGYQFGIARTADVRKIISNEDADWHEFDGFLIPPVTDDGPQDTTDLFDKCWNGETSPHDPTKCAILGGYSCVIEAQIIEKLAAQQQR